MTQAVQSAQGEDRSSYQEILPWTEDSFGFAKATEATGWIDPTFAANWARLWEERKPRGAYHYLHPSLNAAEQANFFMSVVRQHGLEPGDMLAVDVEITAGAQAPDGAQVPEFSDPHAAARSSVPPSGALASRSLVDSSTLQFLQTLAPLAGANQHPLLVYTNLDIAAQLISCIGFELWIAHPVSPPDYSAPQSVEPWPRWRFWQWEFGGGPGGGDRDAYNGTLAELEAWINSFKPLAPTSSEPS
jgi:GH25 family lysozyme M1 (1,4-beta-N-acetylmuramidase)